MEILGFWGVVGVSLVGALVVAYLVMLYLRHREDRKIAHVNKMLKRKLKNIPIEGRQASAAPIED